jgi:hypothetical protein
LNKDNTTAAVVHLAGRFEFIAFNSVFVLVGHSMFGIAAVLPTFLAARTSLQRLHQAMEWMPEVDEQGVLELPPVFGNRAAGHHIRLCTGFSNEF